MSIIDQTTIERIHEAARIEEVVSDFVTLRKRGVNLLGLCPFHNEKTPSFTVSPAKGIFKCFGCGKGGNAVHFVMEHEQLSYVEALKYLARKYHIEVVEKELSAEDVAAKNDRESMFLVNEFAQKHFTTNLHHHAEGKAIGKSYFKERGFREDIIQKFQLGFCLDEKDGFTKEAIKSGYKKEYLVKTGLTFEGENNYLADRFRGRVIFPVHTISGKVVAFGGRALKMTEKTAKYVNSPESEIYHKSNELYGIYFAKQAIVKNERCYLVEGYTDVISMHQSGIENVVASSGTALTSNQIRLIHRFTENVTLIYDNDTAGIKASLRGVDLLLEEGLNIKILLLPENEDPDSFAQKNNASDFIQYVEQNAVDFIRFKTNLLINDVGNDPIKRAYLVQDIVRSIAVIPNQLIRSEYVKECSTLLNVSEERLYHEINNIKTKQLENVKKQTISANLPTTPTVSSSDISDKSAKKEYHLDKEEHSIVQTLLKFGTKFLVSSMNEKNEERELETTVGEYILQELENDNLIFVNPIFEQIRQEYDRQKHLKGFNIEGYFIYHTNEKISRTAAELFSEKYVLSKIHAKFVKTNFERERSVIHIQQIIHEYKLAIIMNMRKEKLLEMKRAFEANNGQEMEKIRKEIEHIDMLKKHLSKELERVINPL